MSPTYILHVILVHLSGRAYILQVVYLSGRAYILQVIFVVLYIYQVESFYIGECC